MVLSETEIDWMPYYLGFLLFLLGAVGLPGTTYDSVPIQYLPLLYDIASVETYSRGWAIWSNLRFNLTKFKLYPVACQLDGPSFLTELNNLILNCNASQPHLKVEEWFLQPTSHQPRCYIVKNLLLRDMQIVMKSCRETHCHFCFNEVPADVAFCSLCTIPIYCSQHCQEQAGGKQLVRKQNILSVQKNLPAHLADYFMDTALASNGECEGIDANFKHIHEHRHECGGAHWSVVLPPDVVLAGPVMVKFKEKRKLAEEICKSIETVEFTHNYNQNSPWNKLELHLYAVVLSYCLQRDYDLVFPSTCYSSSELIMLISKIRVNSMAIVRMKSLDGYVEIEKSPMFYSFENAFTSCVKQ